MLSVKLIKKTAHKVVDAILRRKGNQAPISSNQDLTLSKPRLLGVSIRYGFDRLNNCVAYVSKVKRHGLREVHYIDVD